MEMPNRLLRLSSPSKHHADPGGLVGAVGRWTHAGVSTHSDGHMLVAHFRGAVPLQYSVDRIALSAVHIACNGALAGLAADFRGFYAANWNG